MSGTVFCSDRVPGRENHFLIFKGKLECEIARNIVSTGLDRPQTRFVDDRHECDGAF